MNRGLALMLLCLLLVQPAGPLILFGVQRHVAKREIRQRLKADIPDSRLLRIEIPLEMEQRPNTRFKRLHEKEFRFDGRMYDVVRAMRYGDTTCYMCIEDEKETSLFAGLDVLIRNEMNRNSRSQKMQADVSRLFSSSFLTSETASGCVPQLLSVLRPENEVKALSFREPPPSPPPES